MKRNPGETLFLVALLAALLGPLCLLGPPGLASDDEAVRYVQMKNFALHGTLAIRAPALGLGFAAEDLASGYFEARGGDLVATPPPFFPWLASLFHPVFGDRAVTVLPALFLFLAMLAMGLIFDRLMRRDVLYWLLLAAFLCGSPLFMQGLQFSGMVLALFLIVSALGLASAHFGGRPSGGRLFFASLLMGAAALAGPECLAVALSFHLGAAIVLATQRRIADLKAVLAGAAVGLSAFVLHDVILHGSFPGPYLNFISSFYALSVVRFAALAAALVASAVLLALSRREGIGPVRRAGLSVLALVLVSGAVLVTAARLTVPYLMVFFPAALLVFFGISERIERLRRGKATFEGILAGAIVICLVLGAAVLQPGPRVVLSVWMPMVPLVVVLLAREREAVFSSAGMRLVLAFFCGAALVNGADAAGEQILKYREYNAARIAFLERHTAAGDVLLFEDAGSMHHAGPLFFDRVFLLAKGPADRDRLVGALAAKRAARAYAWTANPMGLAGFDPYRASETPAFQAPPKSGPCCGGSCGPTNFHLVQLGEKRESPLFHAISRAGTARMPGAGREGT